MIDIKNYLKSIYDSCIDGIFTSGRSGYWSNLSKSQNNEFSKILEENNCRSSVKLFMPQFEEMIFSTKREAALELFDQEKKGICIDYGSMWGVLSVGMAKRGHHVIAVDQTFDSLKFLKKRSEEEKLKNIHLVNDDVREINFKDIADYAIINGVLEWIPEISEVVVVEYLNKSKNQSVKTLNKNHLKKPREMQLAFLKKVNESLKKDGQLLLAIENKFAYEYLLGKRDPHVNLLFTTFLPRAISNLISKIFKKKEYRAHIYSFNELKLLLKEAGFNQINDYCCFPMYHFPSLIIPNSKEGIDQYETYENKDIISWKQKLVFRYFEIFLMKYLKAKYFCPAIIVVAKK